MPAGAPALPCVSVPSPGENRMSPPPALDGGWVPQATLCPSWFSILGWALGGLNVKDGALRPHSIFGMEARAGFPVPFVPDARLSNEGPGNGKRNPRGPGGWEGKRQGLSHGLGQVGEVAPP